MFFLKFLIEFDLYKVSYRYWFMIFDYMFIECFVIIGFCKRFQLIQLLIKYMVILNGN